MRTQIIPEHNARVPWLEYHPTDGSRPTKREIVEVPFRIGRVETVEFQIDSTRVSREHAAIVASGLKYKLQDLDSTNGTFLNGNRITEVDLNDGDVITVADVELTFFSGAAARVSATQVMTQPVPGRNTDSADLILQVRQLHESLTHRSITSRFKPIVALEDGEVFGYEAVREMPSRNRHTESMVQTDCRLTERINQQHRLVAAEQASRLEEDTRLFFALQASEVSADFLPETLGRLQDVAACRHKMVAQIPETAVCDIPYFRQFISQLRERSIEVVYQGFCGGPSQIADWSNIAPDYLKLAPSLVNGISRASGGWRKVQTLIQATREIDCAVIAAGIEHEADAQCLRELGCRFGEGELFGAAQPITAYVSQQPLVTGQRN
jgi:EAL domain-containing protein (putative c-di-GMP-specific phosphodiesterase class I)